MIKVFVSGRLAADPVLSNTPAGQTVCKFRIGANTKHRDENNQYLTNWFNCTVWGKQAENVSKFFKKGHRINVEGDLTVRDYTDKNGVARTSIDVDVRDFDFVETRGETTASAPTPTPRPAPAPVQPQFAPVETDELPF